jgi:carbon monoxide dehydrogenase subunit G
MRLERQLTVGAPPDQVWAELLDVADLAECLPGAELRTSPGEPGVRGEMTIGRNGSSVRCRGTLRPVDADDDDRTATIRIHGHEIGGAGLATALLRGHVDTADGATRVHVSADLDVTGQRADPATVQAEAQRLLDAFSERLEQRIRERTREPRPAPGDARRPEPATVAGAPGPGGPSPVQAASAGLAGAFDGRVQTYGLAFGAVAALIVLLRALIRPRKRVTVSLKYRW